MLLVIDNYDSFTYNLVQYLGELGAEMKIFRNDAITVDEIENGLRPERILISPGPGTPDGAGITLPVIDRFAGRVPILGVCLGHQAIGRSEERRVGKERSSRDWRAHERKKSTEQRQRSEHAMRTK